MGGDEWWLGRELRALLEARAAEKAEQCCEKAACPTAPDAPEKAEKGPPAPAPVRASAARRAPGAPWDDVDDALEAAAARSRWLSPAQAFALLRAERGRDARLAALPVRDTASPAEASAAACYVPATSQGLVRPVPVTFQSVVNSYVHRLEEHPTIGVAVCQMSRSKRKPYRSRERKELLEDGYDESQDRIVSHGLTGRMYKLVVRGQSPKPDAPGEAPAAALPELPRARRARCEEAHPRRRVRGARGQQHPRRRTFDGATTFSRDPNDVARHIFEGAPALGRDPSNAARHTFDGAPAPPPPGDAGAPRSEPRGALDPNNLARHTFDGAPAQSHPVFFDGAPPRSRHPAYPYERRGADPVCLFFDGAPKRRRWRSARPPTRRRRRTRASPGRRATRSAPG
ncbi:DUF4205-containing protein [Aureococcus anophagefferens]|nr:DUF4205-containing protein [Aureococcus anophagefferens]